MPKLSKRTRRRPRLRRNAYDMGSPCSDGSRLDSGATGYAVVWQNGQSWVGTKNHMGYNQEAYDAECAALASALEEAAKRQTVPELVTIFTDAQAAIRRMVSEDPGPGQKYAILARQHIRKLRRGRPDIIIEIRWCPAHKGVPGNEKADEWTSSRQKNQTRAEWSRSQGLLRISNGRSRRRNGRTPAIGPEAGSPKRSTRCRTGRNRMEWLHVAPGGTPQGSTG
jgi:ribonuclease HI